MNVRQGYWRGLLLLVAVLTAAPAHADVAARMEGDPQGAAFIANIGKMEVSALFNVVGSATTR